MVVCRVEGSDVQTCNLSFFSGEGDETPKNPLADVVCVPRLNHSGVVWSIKNCKAIR